MGRPGSIAEGLAVADDVVVGRRAELEDLDRSLGGCAAPVRWVFGVGGVGKSTLLAAFAARAQRAGASVHQVDLGLEAPTAESMLAVAAPMVAPDGEPGVLLIDGFERAEHLETWLREALVPSLVSGSVVVVAGRNPPSSAWRLDPVWSDTLALLPLRNLHPPAAVALLERGGVPSPRRERWAAASGGHPLALALLVDAHRSGTADPSVDDLLSLPDVVAGLVGRLVDEAPDDHHREALEVAALARVTTEALLDDVVGGRLGPELFDWLRARPFVRSAPEGLAPHDLAREVLEAELRWRDPARYVDVHHRVREHLLAQLDVPGRVHAVVADVVHLHRGSSLLSSYWEWTSFGAAAETHLRPGDEAAVLAIAEAREHAADLVALRHWLQRQPSAFHVVRQGSEVVGYFALLVLTAPSDDDLAADPVVAAAWAHASRHDPVRPGQVVGCNRFFQDRGEGQGPSPTFNSLTVGCLHDWLTTKGLAWYYIGGVQDPEVMGPLMGYLDFHPLTDPAGGDGSRVLFAHDWRRTPIGDWLDLMERREVGERPTATTEARRPALALSSDDFAAAVRAALRDLARPDRLAENPLLASRLLLGADPASPPAAAELRDVLERAFRSLPDDPRTEKARRALDRTYLRGATSQEAAAEVLGMAFSTYRRHLAAGVALLVEVLWRWELYGEDR